MLKKDLIITYIYRSLLCIYNLKPISIEMLDSRFSFCWWKKCTLYSETCKTNPPDLIKKPNLIFHQKVWFHFSVRINVLMLWGNTLSLERCSSDEPLCPQGEGKQCQENRGVKGTWWGVSRASGDWCCFSILRVVLCEVPGRGCLSQIFLWKNRISSWFYVDVPLTIQAYSSPQ